MLLFVGNRLIRFARLFGSFAQVFLFLVHDAVEVVLEFGNLLLDSSNVTFAKQGAQLFYDRLFFVFHIGSVVVLFE